MLVVLLLAVLPAGCGGPKATNDGVADAGVGDASPDVADAAIGEVDSEGPDVSDAQEADSTGGVALWRASLTDGREVVGEHIWTYDHNRWWEPEPTWSHALFDVSRLRPYPDDHSVHVIGASEIETIDVLAPSPRRPYRQALRDEGIVLSRSPLAGVAHVFTGHDSYHLEEQGYGDNAWDLVVTDEQGRRFTGDGASNEEFLAWGKPVVLPSAGYVVEVVRDAPDNPLGTHPGLGSPNNLVGVSLGGSYYLYLLHFQQDSIPAEVAVDAYLEAGTYLGTVGNSGVTLEPHLHVTVLWYDAAAQPPRSWSVPSEFQQVWTAPTPRGPATFKPFDDPPTGTFMSSEEF